MDLVFNSKRFRFAISTGLEDPDDEFVSNVDGDFTVRPPDEEVDDVEDHFGFVSGGK